MYGANRKESRTEVLASQLSLDCRARRMYSIVFEDLPVLLCQMITYIKTEEYREIKGYWVKRLFLLWNDGSYGLSEETGVVTAVVTYHY